MHLEHQPTGKITTPIKFHYCIYIIFPETVFKTTINSTGIIFSHQIKIIDSFSQKLTIR